MITASTAAVVLFSPPTLAPAVDPNGNPGLADVSPAPARRADFQPAGAFETNYTGYSSGRYVVRDPDLVTADYQQSTIDVGTATPSVSPTVRPTVPGGPAATTAPGATRSSTASDRGAVPRDGRLVVYGVDAFDPDEFLGGEKLQVGGKTALLRYAGSTAPPSATGKYGCCLTPTVPTIAWQYLPGAWAAIYWSTFETAPTRDELIALAGDMPAGELRAFPVGIRLRETLKNYRLLAVSTSRSPDDKTNLSVVRLAMKHPIPPFTAPVELDDYPSIVLTLGVTDQDIAEAIGKTPCQPGTGRCATLIADGRFFLQVESTGDRTAASTELAQILKIMSAEQPEDPATWPPAVKVFTP